MVWRRRAKLVLARSGAAYRLGTGSVSQVRIHGEVPRNQTLVFLAGFLAQSSAETFTELVWESDGFGAAEKFNGLPGLVHDHGAVFAVLEVAFEFLLDGRVEIAIDII